MMCARCGCRRPSTRPFCPPCAEAILDAPRRTREEMASRIAQLTARRGKSQLQSNVSTKVPQHSDDDVIRDFVGTHRW